MLNNSAITRTFTLTCSATSALTCESVTPTSLTLAAGLEDDAVVKFSAGNAIQQQVVLTASGSGVDEGYIIVTIVAPVGVSVTPDLAPVQRTANTSGYSDVFTVTNTSTSAKTYTLTHSSLGSVTTTWLSPSSLTLAASAAGTATVTSSTGSFGTGKAILTATATGARDQGSADVTVVNSAPTGELGSAPREANAGNRADHWGRNYDLHHLGVQLRTQLGANQRLEISPYAQYRKIDHPIFRVINQESRDYGADVRYENASPLFGRTNRLTLGVQPAWLDLDNRQFENEQGAHGELRKNQKDQAVGLAFYGENALALTPRLTGVVGVRLDHAIRKSADSFLADGDQTDHRVFDALLPKLGLLYGLPSVEGQLYANLSRSSEPPLLLELNSLTVPGFIDLRAQDAWQMELGVRGAARGVRWDVAAYDVELSDEILNLNVQPFPGAPFTVPTYRKAPSTRHYGLETGVETDLPVGVARVAYTFARYRFVDDPEFEGNEIPGAPRHHVQAQLRYRHRSGLALTPSVEWVPGAYFVNSANTERNDGWATLGLRAEWTFARLGLTAFAAGENLTDTRYAASVQVDNDAGSSFEPADGRSFYLGFRWNR